MTRALALAWIAFMAVWILLQGSSASEAGLHPNGGDAFAYWAADQAEPYRARVNDFGAYLYSPAWLQAIAPLQLLPWEAFRAVWLLAGIAGLLWLVGPYATALCLIPTPYNPVFTDLWFGNVMVFQAVAVVAGLRHPSAWAFLLLTKLAPGVVMVWHAVRGEWRGVALSAGVTAGIVLVSLAIAPHLWIEWLALLAAGDAHASTIVVRGLLALALVVVGAWRGWRWTVVAAVVLTQPVLWFSSFTILLGWVGLMRRGQMRLALVRLGAPRSALRRYAGHLRQRARYRGNAT